LKIIFSPEPQIPYKINIERKEGKDFMINQNFKLNILTKDPLPNPKELISKKKLRGSSPVLSLLFYLKKCNLKN